METWAILVLVIGLNIITVFASYLLTKMQVSHSDKRLEKELERARQADYRQRRWEVRSEPLLKLRWELVIMTTKQDKVVSAAHKLHTRFGMTEGEAKKELQKSADDINVYIESGNFNQTLFMQYDKELVEKVEEIIRDYRKSFFYAIDYKDLKAKELGEAMKVFERNKDRIVEVQELLNKRLEEL